MDKRLTRLEKQWILYDAGNSAFILLVSTIMPIYFNSLAERGGLSSVQYLAYWGYASSIATLLVALSGPVFGTFSDIKGLKKPLFATAMLIGVLGCAALGFTRQWLWFLIVFVIARFGYAVSLIFYDSMLTDITQPDRMDRVSSHGFAWGYIGSCIPFVWSLGVVLSSEHLGISMETAMAFAFLLTAAWWFCMTLPLLRHFQQRYYVKRQPHAIRMSFSRLWHTLRGMRRQKQVFFFLLAFFFYIDGVYTIIDMATAYGEALGLDSTGLLLALLVTQIVACPCSLLFGRLSGHIAPQHLIPVCIGAYMCIAVFAMFLQTQFQFWILAICVGMFQGGIQALSRSYFAKIIPQEKSGEYFGLLDICGKGAAFMGTAVVSMISQLTGSINLGVGAIVVLFFIGIVLFRTAVACNET